VRVVGVGRGGLCVVRSEGDDVCGGCCGGSGENRSGE
jgi:hypothetical protein